MNIYPTITTGENWRDKFREIEYLRIEKVAVFPTMIEKPDRKSLYQLIEESPIKKIPIVHLRSDMDIEELDFFAKKYDTQIFNTHSSKEFPISEKWLREYRELISIENTHNFPLEEEEVRKYGGICLDMSHLENSRILETERYNKEVEIISKFKIRCNHISAVKDNFSSVNTEKRELRYDSHRLDNHTELDYLKNYPVNYFSDLCAMELSNNIVEQMEAIAYINSFMKNRDNFIKTMIE
ncbi:MAG: hypothetical protein GYA00_01015 [Parcubacteria group bacterium]|nr:hypothetical protein [Parcubacteria group bacterium]